MVLAVLPFEGDEGGTNTKVYEVQKKVDCILGISGGYSRELINLWKVWKTYGFRTVIASVCFENFTIARQAHKKSADSRKKYMQTIILLSVILRYIILFRPN